MASPDITRPTDPWWANDDVWKETQKQRGDALQRLNAKRNFMAIKEHGRDLLPSSNEDGGCTHLAIAAVLGEDVIYPGEIQTAQQLDVWVQALERRINEPGATPVFPESLGEYLRLMESPTTLGALVHTESPIRNSPKPNSSGNISPQPPSSRTHGLSGTEAQITSISHMFSVVPFHIDITDDTPEGLACITYDAAASPAQIELTTIDVTGRLAETYARATLGNNNTGKAIIVFQTYREEDY